MTLKNTLIEVYLDWVNDFLTVERFAEYYGLTVEQADALLRVCKSIYNDSLGDHHDPRNP